jgi:histidinol dehydrogenase
VAGPTEILLIAPKKPVKDDARFLAADMLAQAEHDADAVAILLTTSKRLAAGVAKEIDRQLADLPTRSIASQALRRNSAIVITRSQDEAIEISNRFAPEHLSVPEAAMVKKIQNAGSVFVGRWSPEAAGDYASGPNHVLPTGGAAALLDYVKIISVQQLDQRGLRALAPSVITLARAEGLEAHARSMEVRIHG